LSRTSVLTSCSLFAATLLSLSAAHAQKTYDPGASDTEIKLGQSTPLSGPASAFGAGAGRAVVGYFDMLNEGGGINGRKISFTQLDNAYSAPKAVEQSRKLIEDIGVLAEVGTIGTAPNVAIQKYLNSRKVPQLFITAGGRRFNDPTQFPWTVPLYPDFETEGRVVAKYILKAKPEAKIGVLYQNDDFGKDYLKGLKDGLGDKKSMIAVEASYETTDPTVDSQVVDMKAKGIDVFVNTAIPKFAAQAIRKAAEIEWKPLHVLSSIGASVGATLKPAGFENCKGLISDFYLKDPSDPQWKDDAGFKEWTAFMDKYLPDGDKLDAGYVAGACLAAMGVQVLKQCGNELTRENVMKQAANIHDFTVPMLLPGIKVNTSPTDFAPVKQVQMGRFAGERWELFGELLTGAVT